MCYQFSAVGVVGGSDFCDGYCGGGCGGRVRVRGGAGGRVGPPLRNTGYVSAAGAAARAEFNDDGCCGN